MKNNFDYVLQENMYDCGLACLKTILLYYKIGYSNNDLSKLIKVGNEGINAYTLVKASKKLGFEAYGVKSNIMDISTKKLPCIAHVMTKENLFHYIVIYEINIKSKNIKIMDPAYGIKNVSFDEFEKMTTGIFIIFEEKNIIKSKDKRFKKFIYSTFLENKHLIFKSVILSLGYILFSLICNYYLKLIFDNLDREYKYIIILSFVFLFIYIIKNIINYYKDSLTININNKLDKKINKKIISHIVYLPYEQYLEKEKGEIITLLNDVYYFKEMVGKVFMISSVYVVLIVIALLYISLFNIYYFIALFLLMIFLYFISSIYKYKFNDCYIYLRTSRKKYNNKLLDMINCFDSIKALNIQEKIYSTVNKKYKDVLEKEKNYQKKERTYKFINSLLIDIFHIFVIAISSVTIKNNSNIILFSSIYFLIINFYSEITTTISMSKIYSSSIGKVLDFLDMEEETLSKGKKENIKMVEFKNLSYYKNRQILKNINLVIKEKEKIFITGNSGIGKSTLIKLLVKYFDFKNGNIFIDGTDLKDINIKYIRDNITYASQNEMLFTDTILNNLKIIDCSEQAIEKAINTVCFDKEKTPMNKILEDNGLNISGGERKKIIIARALIKSKSILILDESFNEIDIKQERIILNNIFNNYPNLTVVMISHRSNNIDMFEKVYELNEEGLCEKIK